jgi:hypothetical protein
VEGGAERLPTFLVRECTSEERLPEPEPDYSRRRTASNRVWAEICNPIGQPDGGGGLGFL